MVKKGKHKRSKAEIKHDNLMMVKRFNHTMLCIFTFAFGSITFLTVIVPILYYSITGENYINALTIWAQNKDPHKPKKYINNDWHGI